MVQIETVSVYCASSPRADGSHLQAAAELGTALVEAGLTIYYGGGAAGLMGALADAALAAGGQIIGVRPTFISGIENDHRGVTEMIVTETMHQRKQILLDRGQAFVALPGAIGTMDEVVESIMNKRLGLHGRPICILNLGGFYDPLLQQFRRMVETDLVPPEFHDLYDSPTDVPGIMECLQDHRTIAAAPLLWEARDGGTRTK
ncbi:MAG: TIGR00730 family Rossman fold protein [bacterium]|nr:TIGR00730 family Rossman fold protein [bacterium]